MFSADNVKLQVQRYTYTDWKSDWLQRIGGVISGYSTPDSSDSIITSLETFGDVYRVSLPYNTDIRKADVVTIDWEDYNVKAVIRKRWCSLQYCRAYIVLKDG